MEKKYTPKPIDTSDCVLPPELSALAEELARNVHEVWAANRIANGWQWGSERNDSLKTHPCLVAYDELSESEKDFDRATSVQTLKMILKAGFKILPPENNQIF